MDRASVPAPAQAAVVFQDGLGERRRTTDPTGTEALEVLCLRDELTSVPSFEFALRERVSRLANFRHAYFARVRSVDRLNDPVSTLAVVSDQTPGIRLSQILEVVERKGLTLEINASLCLLRQLVPAVATLHEHARDVAHGAIGPERIIVSPNARVIVTEYVLGAALEQLRYSHERYWKDLHVAVPRSAGQPKFDHRADALQLGLVALALVLGRPLQDHEYPAKIGEVVASAWAISARGGFEPLPAGLRAWLMRALQLDVRASFMSASDARAELEKLIGENDLLAAPITLETFLDQFRAAVTAAAPAPQASVVRPPAAAAPPIPKPRPEAPRPPQPVASPPDPAPRRPAPSSEPFPVPSATLRVPSSAPATPAAPRVDPPPPVHSGRSPEPPLVKEPPRPAYEPRKDDQFEILSLASATTPVKTPRPPEYHKDYKEQKAAKDHKDPTRDIDTITSLWTAPTPAPMPAPTSFTTDQPRRRPRPLVIAFVVTALVLSGGLFASRMFVSDTAPAGNGTLILSTHPTGAQVVVDGQSRGITPLTLTLKAGAHVVQLRGAGQPRTIPVAIAADTQVSQYIELPGSGAAVGPGQLQVRTEPAGARVSVDGVPRGTAPITIGDLPPGEHHVVLSNDLGSVKQTVTIQPGMTASLVVPLSAAEGAPASGWISVAAPVEVEVYENNRLIGTSRSDRLMMTAGRHEIEIKNEPLGYRIVRTVQVPAGKGSPIRVDFPQGTIAINAIPWAEVWIDGEKVGETPIGNLAVTIGPHEVVFRHPELGEQRHAVTVTLTSPARISVDMRQK